MTRRLVPVAVVGLAVAVVAPAHAGPGRVRVIDRTFTCAAGYLGGVYEAEVESYWSLPPQVERRTASATVTTNLTDGFLGGISSRSMYVNRRYCKATSAKVRLTTKKLDGGAFPQLGTEYNCFTPRRVLLRVRGEFVNPTTLRTASPFGYPQLRAQGAMRRAELAVATLAAKPLAYASIVGPETARLFISTADCQED